MQTQSPDELATAEAQGLLARAIRVVFIGERNRVRPWVEVSQAVVGQPNAVGIAREISEDGRGASEGTFGIDDPGFAGDVGEEALKRAATGKGFNLAVKLELAGLIECAQAGAKLPAIHG